MYVPIIEVAVCDPEASHLCQPCSGVTQNHEEGIGNRIIFENCLQLFYLFIGEWMPVCLRAPCTFNQEARKGTGPINPCFLDVPVQGCFRVFLYLATEFGAIVGKRLSL